MDDDIDRIDQHPVTLLKSFHAALQAILLQERGQVFGDRCDMAAGAA